MHFFRLFSYPTNSHKDTPLQKEYCCDYLYVYENASLDTYVDGTTSSGYWKPDEGPSVITTRGPTVYLKWDTDFSIAEAGFRVRVIYVVLYTVRICITLLT